MPRVSKSTANAGTKHRQGGRSDRIRVVRQAKQADSPQASALPMLRTSERSTLKRCEFQWYLSYERQLRSGTPMPALRFGTLIHIALAAYYVPGVKRGKHPTDAFVKAYKADLKENETRFGAKVGEDEKWVDALDLGTAMLDNYISEYGSDDLWEVIATEHPFRTLVHNPVTGEPWFWYTGIVDGLWRHRGTKKLWIADHKTAATLGDSKLSYLQMDDQAGAYWSFGVESLINNGYLRADEKLAGMLYNFLRKALPDERESKIVKKKRLYVNKDGTISKKQPPPYFQRLPIFRDVPDRAMAYERALNDFHRREMLQDGTLTLTKNPGQFTCPMCPMTDICELHEVGQDWEGFLKDTTHTWEPYAEHEVYTAETK